jgi:indolepyruvate ferredoxin oxidoreductase
VDKHRDRTAQQIVPFLAKETSTMTASHVDFTLEDRYRVEDGLVYLSGIQALVRMLVDRARTDRRLDRDIATYVSGYEGSPLAGYDLELGRRQDLLRQHRIHHQPGLNEELAATAVSGTQLAGQVATAKYAGVTGVWYGKAPGLDRASDAIRHANLIGTSGSGGVVALVGDDPSAKSSSVPSASEAALADLGVPTLYPADPGEILEYGQHAIELSRACGLWTALKVATNVADGSATARVRPTWQAPAMTDLKAYAHVPSAQLLAGPLAELERSQHLVRFPLAIEYVRRSGLNRIIGGDARIGIVAAGKTYLDVRQALTTLGLAETDLSRYGIRLLKLGAVYPIEPSIVREFARGLHEIVVVEDKRPFLEDALKAVLYGVPDAPPVIGKRRADGAPLFSMVGELDPDSMTAGLAHRLSEAEPVERWLRERAARPAERTMLPLVSRTPYFCSGCPHNSSTKVAEGTLVGGGIGCHAMALFMPEQQVGKMTGLSQMGGEGAQWIGMAPFVTEQHFVQNIGDGTFTHSGSLSVRAAVAAGVNITFKLLHNSTVAMTGGQTAVGELPLDRLVDLLKAEGVARVVVTTDQPRRLRRQLGRHVDVRGRDQLVEVQRELAAVQGVTVLVHDQECAAEKRRKRRRQKLDTPPQRVVINERVCEGCGDCGQKSNCLSVEPVSTEFGRKTQINQSSCNLDFSCLEGDCPSFVTVVPSGRPATTPASGPLPDPVSKPIAERFTMRIAGVGGTGVITIAQVLGTAAFLDGKSVRSLDQTGLAQKGGAVISDLTITPGPEDRGAKLMRGECDLCLGCDSLVAGDAQVLRVASPTRTTAILSTAEVPTGHMVVDTSVSFPPRDTITAAVAEQARALHLLDARTMARDLLGDEQYANMITVGAAFQVGALPLTLAAITRAIRLNGATVDANLLAFEHGRRAMTPATPTTRPESVKGTELARVVGIRVPELIAYQNAKYASTYADFVERTRQAEAAAIPGSSELTTAVARNLYKLMAYKDEYEVARLSLDPALTDQITAQFGSAGRPSFRLHPPMLRAMGMSRKITFGPWFRWVFRFLYAMRILRGSPLDPFGFTRVRRVERALVTEYRAVVESLLGDLRPATVDHAREIAELPDMVRGFEEIKLRNVEAYHARLAERLRHGADMPPHLTSAVTQGRR